MHLHDLSEDEIRCILAFCDISAVVAMSETNKYLRLITLGKVVWLELVKNLRRQGFLDRLSLSDLQACSQEALVDLVKGILTGPACWNPPVEPKSDWIVVGKPRPTESVLQIAVQSVIHPSPAMDMSKKKEAKLLGGGDYVLFNNQTLECWSVRHNKRIWAHELNDPDSVVVDFTGEIVDQGDSVNVIVLERVYDDGPMNPSFIQIVKLNFATGLSTTLYRHRYPGFDGNFGYGLTDVKICGPLASAYVEEYGYRDTDERERCILINWQTKSQVTLSSTAYTSPLRVALIPDHFLFLTNNTSGGPEIRVIHTPTALASHWRPAANPVLRVGTIDLWKLAAVICESITFGKSERFQPPHVRELCAYRSPLEDGTYRVWISLYGSKASSSPRQYGAVICSYHLSLPRNAGDPPLWQQRTAALVSANPGINDFTFHQSPITYSGHRHQYSRQRYAILAPRDPMHLAALPAPNGSHHAHLSTYSGALTYFNRSERTVSVSYFEWTTLSIPPLPMNFQPLPLPSPRFQAPRDLLAPVRQCECNCLTNCSCSCPCRDHCTCKAACDGACAAHLSRNLVVCLDDISNKPWSENTNVIELYRRVLADINQSQLTYYDCAGIQFHHSGIFQAWLRPIKYAMDRALGLTLKKTVLKAYRWLCEQYRPGDQIFLFGFARGAYQARILGDMIQRVGLVNAGNPDLVALSYEVYLETRTQQAKYTRNADNFTATFSRAVKIHFIGVWDTPASVGRKFPPRSSADHVCFFRHALALDEMKIRPIYERSASRRVEIAEKPTDTHTATSSTETKVPIGPGQGTDGMGFQCLPEAGETKEIPELTTDVPNIKEVWFAGDQADIGGLKPQTELSCLPLLWMENEASLAGLRLRLHALPDDWRPDALAAKSLSKPVQRGRKLFPSRVSTSGSSQTPHIGKDRLISRGQRIHVSVAFHASKDCPRAIFTDGGVDYRHVVDQEMKQEVFEWVPRYSAIFEMDLFSPSFVVTVINEVLDTWNGEELSAHWIDRVSFLALSEKLAIMYLQFTLKRLSDAAAEIELGRALNLFQKLADKRPAIFSGDLAEVLEAQGRFRLIHGKDDPAQLFEDAICLRRTRASMPTSSSFSRFKFAASLVWFGSYTTAMHNPQKAIHLFAEGLDVLRALLACEYPPAPPLFALLQGSSAAFLKDVTRDSDIQLALGLADTIVVVAREVAAAHPQYTPVLAAALHDLAFAFPAGRSSSELNAAEESVSLYQELANRHPQVYGVRYADALHNFSGRLFATGVYQKALCTSLEEVRMRRKLPEKECLASGLDQLSRCFAATGRIDVALNNAEEAVRIRRKVVEENMTAKSESQLADSLNNLSCCLSLSANCAQRALDTAREATTTQRGLVRDTPARPFDLRLGILLHNFSAGLSAVGKFQEALKVQEEAVRILARGGVDICIQALSLSRMAYCLKLIARDDTALVVAESCSILANKVAATGCSQKVGFDLRTQAQLAETFFTLSFCFAPLQHTKSVQTVTESITIYRQLTRSASTVFLAGLVRALLQHSYLLSLAGQHEEALRLSTEASQIGCGLSKDIFSTCLYQLSLCLHAVGKDDRGMQPALQCVEIRRSLAREYETWQFKLQLVDALFNLSLYSARFPPSAILLILREAVEIERQLGEHSPSKPVNTRLLDGLQNCAAYALLAGEYDEALSSIEEAVGLTRRLVEDDPTQYSPVLVNVLYTYANILCATGEYEKADRVISEASGLLKVICSDSIFASSEARAAYMSTEARCLMGLGRWDEAVRDVVGAIELYRKVVEDPQNTALESFPWFFSNIFTCISTINGSEAKVAEAKADVVGLVRVLTLNNLEKYGGYLQQLLEL